MKNNRVLIFLIIIVCAFALISCSEEVPENIQETQTPQNIPNLNVVTTKDNAIFSAGTYTTNLSAEFESATAHGLETTDEFIVLENIAKKMRQNPFDPQHEIFYEKSECSYLKGSSGEYGTFYSMYDIYISGESRYDYLHGTDILCQYFGYRDDGVQMETVPTTQEEAKKMAGEFIDSVYGEDFVSNYEIHAIVEDNGMYAYQVVYVRMVAGYKTDDTIAVYIDYDGSIKVLKAPNVGKYDYLIDRISKEKVDSAKDILLSKLQSFDIEDFQVVGMAIITDRVGNPYLKLRYSHTVEHSATPHEELVYISIN